MGVAALAGLAPLARALFGWEDAHHAAAAIQALVSAGADLARLRREREAEKAGATKPELVVGRSDGEGGVEEVPLGALLAEHGERIEKLERGRPRRRRRRKP